MPKTYYDSELTAEQIEAALTAVDGVVNPGNNGKVLYIEDGQIKASSASRWSGGAVLEPLSVTANGDYTPPTGTDGFNSVHVAVPGAGNIQPLSVTQNGTYNPPSGVDGYAPVTVNVSGSQPNLWNWKRYRQLARSYNGGSISFVSDNSFELTGNGGDVFTTPNGLTNDNIDAQYPAVQGQVFVLRWDVDPEYASLSSHVYIFEGSSTTNMSYTNYGAGELRHTVVGSTTRLSFRFGNRMNGVALKYYNCRFYIEE